MNNDLEENYFCGKKLNVKWVHKLKILDKLVNITDLTLTHTSRDTLSNRSSLGEISDKSSFSQISSIQEFNLKKVNSIEVSSKSSFVKSSLPSLVKSPHPSLPKINSRLKLIFV